MDKVHVPIGIPDSVDAIKTFVEDDASFSPGCGSFGVSFGMFLSGGCLTPFGGERSYTAPGCLIPQIKWRAGELQINNSVAQSEYLKGQAVACRVEIINSGKKTVKGRFYVIIRPEGPAGYSINKLEKKGSTLLVNGHTGVVFSEMPDSLGVSGTDNASSIAGAGEQLSSANAVSKAGNCSAIAAFEITLGPGKTKFIEFTCPVLAGRRVLGHDWDGVAKWGQFDLSSPDPKAGELQPDYGKKVSVKEVFNGAETLWNNITGNFSVGLPDPRWNEALKAILCHSAMNMNEGAPDVSVVNYNVFNRDGVYTANIFQKSGNFSLAEKAIDYFLRKPFNGRTDVEADNPGQVLWIMGQHWLFKKDLAWLKKRLAAVKSLTGMIRYYRTKQGPHFVKAGSLKYGKALPSDKRGERDADQKQILRPGSCDGYHPEYTEAFDVAGLMSAEMLLLAAGDIKEAGECAKLSARLMKEYDRKFGKKLAEGYGSYSVLWPCALYPYSAGKANKTFRGLEGQKPESWRYFPLATGHQGLLAGSRAAGYKTIEEHLAHPQMKGWYLFDEGGKSSSGGWNYYRTKWDPSCAMPHGWAIAELWLLIRDSLVYEDGNKLVLFSGIDPKWFKHDLKINNLPTKFGKLTASWSKGKLSVFGVTGCEIVRSKIK